MSEPLLRVNAIETFYGPIQAIRGVSLDVEPGQIVTVLGANGAGKTTVLRTISGVLDPERGQVMFEGRDIAHMAPDQVMRMGICHVPEGRETFPFLTVKENLMMGAYTRRDHAGVTRDLDLCYDYFPRLKERQHQRAGLLSGGEQALTALSLIFAVFLVNPAPVCVLDEVDAPLDDANVERFCNLLDEMTRITDTRFLVITHHALTMSRMNRLFGVTMAERGVSQLVSVTLAQAEQVIAAE